MPIPHPRRHATRSGLPPLVLAALLWAGILGVTTEAAAAAAYPVVAAFGGISFQQHVQVVFAPGETTRAFVVERAGTIAMVPDITNPARQVILDLSGSVNPSVNDSGHGMLSMVFHPNFAQNGYFYVWTSIWEGGSRFTRQTRDKITGERQPWKAEY